MAQLLRQSTAVDVLIGPFVDEDDGKTAENALTIEDTDIFLSKNGQALAAKNDTTDAANDSLGYYNCELDATDTNTVGQLTLVVHESGALPVRIDYQVVEESVYDAIYASGADAITLADINAEVDTALADVQLDHLAGVDTGVAADGDLSSFVVDGSILSHIMTAGADTSDYQASTDSVEAIRNHVGDGTNLTEAGGTGDQFTAIPWNANWDTEVESECNDALVALNLDHLAAVDTGVAADADLTGIIVDGSILSHLMTAGADTSDYAASTDSLQGMRDDINAEVVDVIRTDTLTLPAQGAPSSTPTLSEAVAYLYKNWRNKALVDSNTGYFELYADNGVTVDQKAAITDAGGITTIGEIITGA